MNRTLRVIRPKDAALSYSFPAAEFARMASFGTLLRLAHGYYAIPPKGWVGRSGWVPSVEAVALAIAQADHGQSASALCHMSAARVLHVVPRALATGIVAIPTRRRTLSTRAGLVVFQQRDLNDVAVQRISTELADGWTTTTEQTLIDIADHPTRAGISKRTASEAVWSLAQRSDWDAAADLAFKQGKKAAYARARWASDQLVHDAPVLKLAHPVSSRGLQPIVPTDPVKFSIRHAEP